MYIKTYPFLERCMKREKKDMAIHETPNGCCTKKNTSIIFQLHMVCTKKCLLKIYLRLAEYISNKISLAVSSINIKLRKMIVVKHVIYVHIL